MHNNLSCLNLKNCIKLQTLGTNAANGNPNLTCIEVTNPSLFTSAQNATGITYTTNCNYPAGCFTTNIEEYYSNISIYPNPTNNLIQIEIENYNGSFEAELYDFTGKLLASTNSTSLSLSDYPTGIYLLKVVYGDRVEQLKVVKE